MGNCAGLSQQKKIQKKIIEKQRGKQRSKPKPISHVFIKNQDSALHDSSQYPCQSEFMKKSHNNQWKLTMRKYDKPMTLYEEEKQSKMLAKKQQKQSKIQFKSKLTQSVISINKTSPEKNPSIDRSHLLINQRFINDQVKEIQDEDDTSQKNEETIKNNQQSSKFQVNSPFTLEKKNTYEPSHFGYPLKKNMRNRKKQFTEVLQMFSKGAETPNYVRNLRKQYGEDINMDNFAKFDAIPIFKGFSIEKYLAQISQQKLLSKSKLSNEFSTQKKKPNFRIKLQNSSESKVIQNNKEDEEINQYSKRSGKEEKIANKENKSFLIKTINNR